MLVMSRFRRLWLVCLIFAIPFVESPSADTPKMKQFICVLRVVPRLRDEKKWTDADNKAVQEHFSRLKRATEAGTVILAGRTDDPLDRTFGIVVFESRNDAEALAFMKSDPTVVAGVMTAELHPYSVALLRK